MFLTFMMTLLQQYGYPLLWICTCIAAVGLPLPMSLLLLAAGASAALGEYNLFLLIIVTVSASVIGDSLSYLIGKRVGVPLLYWLSHKKRARLFTPQRLQQAHTYFEKRSGWAVFFSRFLFSGLGGVINLLAGADSYPFKRFFIADFAGEILGAIVPLGLGYIFGASWEAVGDVLHAISIFALIFAIAIVLLIQLVIKVRASRNSKAEKWSARFPHKQKRYQWVMLEEQTRP